MLHEKSTGETFPFDGPYQSRLGSVGLAVGIGLAYFMVARLGLALRANTGTSVFWPAAGIAVSVLIVLGPRARLPVAAGVMVATAVVQRRRLPRRPAFTAFHATLSDGPVSGQWVLVQGGAGAVGVVAVELARWSGAKVIATVSSPEKAEIAQAAGADHVIDYRAEDVVARVKQITGGAGVERIVEVDFGANVAVDAEIIAENGTVASYSSTRVRGPVLPYYSFALKGARLQFVQGINMPRVIREAGVRTIVALAERGMLKPRIARTFPLRDIAAAHELVEQGNAIGNVVVEPEHS